MQFAPVCGILILTYAEMRTGALRVELYEKTISSETVFKGNIVELRVDRIELPDGRPARREVIAHPAAWRFCPITIRWYPLPWCGSFGIPLGGW